MDLDQQVSAGAGHEDLNKHGRGKPFFDTPLKMNMSRMEKTSRLKDVSPTKNGDFFPLPY